MNNVAFNPFQNFPNFSIDFSKKNIKILLVSVLSTILVGSYLGFANFNTILNFFSKNFASKTASVNFEGKDINFLKLFGQTSLTETTRSLVDGFGIYHAAGIVVDKNSSPNKVYVVDTANSRILGYNGAGFCKIKKTTSCTINRDCGDSSDTCIVTGTKRPDLVIGQSDLHNGACNHDSNLGIDKKPDNSTLCLIGQPNFDNNVAEYWMRLNIDIDNDGNLYVPDIWNDRVLKYNKPFGSNKSNNEGDNIADKVWGQDNFLSNGPNKGNPYTQIQSPTNSTLNISHTNPINNVSSRGMSVDANNNVWVADTFNNRVLRFSQDSQTANLVLGQNDFISTDRSACNVDSSPPGKLCNPTLARINPYSGDLYVVDEYPLEPFKARIVVFHKTGSDFTNGMNFVKEIVPKQPLINNPDYGKVKFPDGTDVPKLTPFKNAPAEIGRRYKYIFQATGLVFNPFYDATKSDPYSKGVMWVNEHQSNRTLLIDNEGNILANIGGTDVNTRGGDNVYNSKCASLYPEKYTNQPYNIYTDFHVGWPGGSIGFDSDNNIYLADEFLHRVGRYSLPYKTTELKDGTVCLPEPNGGLFPGNSFNVNTLDLKGALSGFKIPQANADKKLGESIGATVFNGTTDQLIVSDEGTIKVWNNYKNRSIGDTPDYVLSGNGVGGLRHLSSGIDEKNRLWLMSSGYQIRAYQLPIKNSSDLPVLDNMNLVWKDDNSKVNLSPRELTGITIDKVRHIMYIPDGNNNRILRVKNYSDIASAATSLVVDMVIGQPGAQPWISGYDSNGKGIPTTDPKQVLLCNHNQKPNWRAEGAPTDDGLCALEQTKIDPDGNLYVVENTYECHGNDRISVFMYNDLNAASGLFPNVKAKKVFNQNDLFTKSDAADCGYNKRFAPGSPVTISFNKSKQLVIANDGYYFDLTKRSQRQLYLYTNPLNKQTPDKVITVPMGTPGEIAFDNDDNLMIQDATWSRVFVVNLNLDPVWLQNLETYRPRGYLTSTSNLTTYVNKGITLTSKAYDDALDLNGHYVEVRRSDNANPTTWGCPTNQIDGSNCILSKSSINGNIGFNSISTAWTPSFSGDYIAFVKVTNRFNKEVCLGDPNFNNYGNGYYIRCDYDNKSSDYLRISVKDSSPVGAVAVDNQHNLWLVNSTLNKQVSLHTDISDLSGDLTKAYILVEKSDQSSATNWGCASGNVVSGKWCKIASIENQHTEKLNITGNWTPTVPGNYYAAVVAYDQHNSHGCSGDPLFTYSGQTYWVRCDSLTKYKDYVNINVFDSPVTAKITSPDTNKIFNMKVGGKVGIYAGAALKNNNIHDLSFGKLSIAKSDGSDPKNWANGQCKEIHETNGSFNCAFSVTNFTNGYSPENFGNGVQWTPAVEGTYYIYADVGEANGNRCYGNPFIQKFNGTDYPCGVDSVLTVNVTK